MSKIAIDGAEELAFGAVFRANFGPFHGAFPALIYSIISIS
jgi:hypothetical protein